MPPLRLESVELLLGVVVLLEPVVPVEPVLLVEVSVLEPVVPLVELDGIVLDEVLLEGVVVVPVDAPVLPELMLLLGVVSVPLVSELLRVDLVQPTKLSARAESATTPVSCSFFVFIVFPPKVSALMVGPPAAPASILCRRGRPEDVNVNIANGLVDCPSAGGPAGRGPLDAAGGNACAPTPSDNR